MHRPVPHRRRVAGLLVLACASAALVGCTSDAHFTPNAATSGEPKGHEVEVLFALNGETAQLAPDGDGYQVTMRQIGDVLVFTDRPVREAKRTTPALLVEQWDSIFGDDPPNGALSGVTAAGESVDVAVEITKIDGDNATTTFTVNGPGDGGLDRLPKELRNASLFIDDAVMNTCPGQLGESAQMDCSTEIIYASTLVPFDSSF